MSKVIEKENIGTNLKCHRDGDTLIIELNVKDRNGDSKSGKTTIVASTGGNITVPGTGGLKLGINAYIPK